MSRVRVRIRALILIALPLFLTSSALAWVQSGSQFGPVRKVVSGSLTFTYEQDGSPSVGAAATHAALDAARTTINNVAESTATASRAMPDFNLTEPIDDDVAGGASMVDGRNSIFFFTTDANDDFDNSVLAVALVAGTVSGSEFQISDCDILFNNENFIWSTATPPQPNDPVSGNADIQAVATHEMLRCFGLDSSPITGRFNSSSFQVDGDIMIDWTDTATLFPFDSGTTQQRSLEPDDIAALGTLYPDPTNFTAALGSITGTVKTSGGTAVTAAHVVVVSTADPSTPVVGYLSNVDVSSSGTPGFYRLTGLAPGTYYVRIEPLTEYPNFFEEASVFGGSVTFDDTFPPEFWSGVSESASDPVPGLSDTVMVTVSAGMETQNVNFITNTVDSLAGDNFATPVVMASSFTRVMNVQSATVEGGVDVTGSCFFGSLARTVWFEFTAPGVGTATFSTLGSSYDTAVRVRTAGSSAEVACHEDVNDLPTVNLFTFPSNPQSEVTFAASSGTTYRFMVSDSGATGAPFTLVVNFDFDINDPPVAVDDGPYMTDEETTLMVNAASGLLANDTDDENDPLMVNTGSVTQPLVGSVMVMADGSFTFAPDHQFLAAGETQTETFMYRANDGLSDSNLGSVTVDVTGANDPPAAGNDSFSTPSNTPLLVSAPGVLANDTDPDTSDTLTVDLLAVVQPANGSVVAAADGSFTYTPDLNFRGMDSFTYQATDGVANSNTATVTITVNNQAPTAADDMFTVDEDSGATVFDVLANDADPEGDTLTITGVTQGANGTVTISMDMLTVSYTPNADFNGMDSFTYTLDDGMGGQDTATVNVTVNSVNDNPVAADDMASGNEDTTIGPITVLANDTDVENDTLTITMVTQGANGSVVINGGNLTVTYTPNANFNGMDSFTYTASDGNGGTDMATVNVTVTAVNDPPSFTGGPNQMVTEDAGAQSIPNWATAISPGPANEAGQTVTFQVTNNTNAALFSVQPAVSSTGTLTYTPAANANGSASITITLMDNGGTANGGSNTSAPFAFSITVTAVNDPPSFTGGPNQMVTEDSGAQTVPNWATSISPGPANEAAQTLQFNVTNNTNAALFSVQPAVSSTGTLTFTSAANTSGSASITIALMDNGGTANGGADTSAPFTFTITITAVNDPPVATDDMASGNEDAAIGPISVLTNDTDIDGGALTVVSVTQGANGSVAINGGNLTVTYTPNTNFNGMDSFTYTVSDGNSGTDIGTVNVTVTAVNDPPSFANAGAVNRNEDDGAITVAAWATNISAGPANESGQTLQFNVTGNTNPGLFTVQPAISALTGNLTFTLAPNASGSSTITVVLLDNGGIANGGSDSSAPVMFAINVAAVNDPPVANDDVASGNEDTSIGPISVLTNDTDIDGGALTVMSVTQGANGSVVINGGNLTVTYTPNANFNGMDSFTYTVSDGNGGTDIGTVNVTVTAVNDAPVAVDDVATGNEDTSIGPITVLTNDTDVENDTLTITMVTQGSNGSVVINGGTTVTYTPNPNFNGMDSFTYTVSDGTDTDTATVNVTVTAVNDAPSFTGGPNQMVAEDSGPQTVAGWATGISPGGGADEAAQVLTFNVTGNTSAALFSSQPAVSPTGTLTYTPAANANGSASVTIRLMDNGGTANGGSNLSAPFTFTITVTAVNDPPVAGDDMFSSQKNTTLNQPAPGVLANDTDVDNNPLVVTTTAMMPTALGGTVTVNANGSFSYTPAVDFDGNDTFTYSISDGQGGSDNATVTIFISPNAPPTAVDDMATTNEDTFVDVSVLANDSDADGPMMPLSISGFTQGANGAVTNPSAGILRYTPNANFNGMDSFTYDITDGIHTRTATVNITVNGVNDPPSFTGGPNQTVAEDSGAQSVPNWATSISPGPANEAGQTLSFSVTGNTNAALFSAQPAVSPTGTLTYTPAANATGSANVTLVLMDNGGTANGGSNTSAPFMFSITVTPVNDPPVAMDDVFPNLPETAGPTTLDVLANDTDIDGGALSISAVGSPSCGMAVNNGSNLTYTPNNIVANCAESFTYTASDGAGGMDSATVTFTVLANQPPNAANDAATTLEDSFVNTSVLVNDSDPENDPLSISGFTQGANGAVTNQGGGVLRYAPNANFNGMDSFTYDASDGQGNMDTATVNVTITAVNDAPSFTGGPNQTVTEDSGAQSGPGWATNLSPGPANEAGQTLQFNVTNNTNAALFSAQPAVSATGTLTFTPALNANGSADVTIVLMDNGGTANGGVNTSAPFTFTITITAVNDPPTIVTLTSNPASPAPATSAGGRSVMFSAAVADVEPDTHTFDWSGDCGTSSGQAPTLTCPIGINTVNVTVDDGNGGTDTASLDITVTDYVVAAQCQGGNPPCNSATMATINDGQAVSFNLTATGINGTYNANITFSCQGLPSLTTCTFTPSNTLPNAPPGGSTVTVRIQTTAATFARLDSPRGPHTSPPPVYALWLGVPGLALFGVVLAGRGKRRRLGTLCLLALVLLMGGMLAGCGGGGGDFMLGPRPGTPTGSHNITIRAAGTGTLDHTVNLTVVVQ